MKKLSSLNLKLRTYYGGVSLIRGCHRQFGKLLAMSAITFLSISTVKAQAPLWGIDDKAFNPVTGAVAAVNPNVPSIIVGFSPNPSGTGYYAYNGDLNTGGVYHYPGFSQVLVQDPEAGKAVPFIIPDSCRNYYSVYNVGSTHNLSNKTIISRWYYDNVNYGSLTGIIKVSSQDLFPTGSGYYRQNVTVTAPLRSNGTRAIYSLASNNTTYNTDVVRFEVSTKGNLGSIVNLGVAASFSASELHDQHVKPEVTDDERYLFCSYTAGTDVVVYQFDLQTNTRSKIATIANAVVSGLEWMPAKAFDPSDPAKLYVSWRASNNSTGGICYYDLSSIPTGGYSGAGVDAIGPISNPVRFGFSDIERSSNNYLYVAENPTPTSGLPTGNLWQLYPPYAGYGFTSLMYSGANISVSNNTLNTAYIIQGQIDGEPYGIYSSVADVPNFTLNGISQTGSAIPTVELCNTTSLVLNRTSSYASNFTIRVEKGTVSGSTFMPFGTTTATDFTKGFSPSATSIFLNTEFPTLKLDSVVDGLRITVTGTNICGTGGSVSKTMTFKILQSSAIVDFDMYSGYCQNGLLSKPRTMSLPIDSIGFGGTSTNPGNAKQVLCDTITSVRSYQGASTAGIHGADLTPSNWNIKVYEVDGNNGNPLTNPPVYIVNESGSTTVASIPADFLFNDYPVDSTFEEMYEDAADQSLAALIAFGQRTWKVVMTATAFGGTCSASTFSYFKIAAVTSGAAVRRGSQWRLANPNGSEDEDIQIQENVQPIVPNPTSGNIVLSSSFFRNGSTISLHISDLLGRSVFSGSEIRTQNVNLSELPIGLYIYQIQAGSKRYTGKLEKK